MSRPEAAIRRVVAPLMPCGDPPFTIRSGLTARTRSSSDHHFSGGSFRHASGHSAPFPGAHASLRMGWLANAEPAIFRELDEERPAGRDVHLFLELPPPARAFRRAFRLPVGERDLDEPTTV